VFRGIVEVAPSPVVKPFLLSDDLATELYRRLGVDPPTGFAGVATLYRAWCATVPFDSVAKNLALVEGRTPPGDDPGAVAREFLTTGLGGLCWGHCAVLVALLTRSGIPASVGLDRMVRTDGRIDFHSVVVVHDGDRRWLLDPVHVSGSPLALVAGARGDHPVIATAIDPDTGHEGDTGAGAPDVAGRGRLRHRVEGYGRPGFAYAVLSTCLDRDDVAAFCAVSARFSGVPDGRLALRRVTPAAVESLRLLGPEDGFPRPVLAVHRQTADGVTVEPHDDPHAAFAALGVNDEGVRRARAAGLLDERSG
jgi:hypothetical protein